MDVYRMIVGAVVLVAGLAWAALTILAAFDGAPDGPLWGWGPLIAAIILAAAGVAILLL